ncbi:hypothetical protein BHM03_00039870 [Ensete ventricosum]|nr:hypothetical protein BHM03_00039870 [Ensete ventricosum]
METVAPPFDTPPHLRRSPPYERGDEPVGFLEPRFLGWEGRSFDPLVPDLGRRGRRVGFTSGTHVCGPTPGLPMTRGVGWWDCVTNVEGLHVSGWREMSGARTIRDHVTHFAGSTCEVRVKRATLLWSPRHRVPGCVEKKSTSLVGHKGWVRIPLETASPEL